MLQISGNADIKHFLFKLVPPEIPPCALTFCDDATKANIIFTHRMNSTIIIDVSNIPEEKKPNDVVQMTEFQMNLKDICRKAIRKHLLHLDPNSHLFGRVPLLPLPEALKGYLLYYKSLDEKERLDNNRADNKRVS